MQYQFKTYFDHAYPILLIYTFGLMSSSPKCFLDSFFLFNFCFSDTIFCSYDSLILTRRNILTTPIQLYYTSQYLGVSTDILCGNREKMYLNVLEYELSCTGIYWKFEIVQYWKIKNVLENVLECTGISFSILCGHPDELFKIIRNIGLLFFNAGSGSYWKHIMSLTSSEVIEDARRLSNACCEYCCRKSKHFLSRSPP